MATLYTDQTAPYAAQSTTTAERERHASRPTHRTTGGLIFVWVAWALAAAFWAATATTAVGILQATGSAQGPTAGGVDAGGAGWGLITVVGVAILGLALAYGAFRYATRNRSKDAMTEASTAALYDSIESGEDDDLEDRSPEAREPEQRASYRPAGSELH